VDSFVEVSNSDEEFTSAPILKQQSDLKDDVNPLRAMLNRQMAKSAMGQ